MKLRSIPKNNYAIGYCKTCYYLRTKSCKNLNATVDKHRNFTLRQHSMGARAFYLYKNCWLIPFVNLHHKLALAVFSNSIRIKALK